MSTASTLIPAERIERRILHAGATDGFAVSATP